MTALVQRRGFLRGLVSLPLIGGSVGTLIGRPAAAHVPLTDVLAMPTIVGPRARARYAWQAFSAAMREMTAGCEGWIVASGGDRREIPENKDFGGPWLRLASIHYERDTEPRCPTLIVERHRDIIL